MISVPPRTPTCLWKQYVKGQGFVCLIPRSVTAGMIKGNYCNCYVCFVCLLVVCLFVCLLTCSPDCSFAIRGVCPILSVTSFNKHYVILIIL